MAFMLILLVTPCVGVWIEIRRSTSYLLMAYMSLPAWECGLKSAILGYCHSLQDVTPCVGVWIEIVCTLTSV